MKQISCESGLAATSRPASEAMTRTAGLFISPSGKRVRRELLLREAEEEVGLVLGLVGGAGEDPAAAGLVVMVAGVVAGGDAVGADLAGGGEELVELEVVVAEGAGDGRAAGEVLVDEGADDLGLEAGLLVDEVVGDVELLGYAAGVVDVVDGAAAALDGLGHAFVSGEAALVPELEGEADEGVALGAEQRGDGGGVDSSGHGYGDRVVGLLQASLLFSQSFMYRREGVVCSKLVRIYSVELRGDEETCELGRSIGCFGGCGRCWGAGAGGVRWRAGDCCGRGRKPRGGESGDCGTVCGGGCISG